MTVDEAGRVIDLRGQMTVEGIGECNRPQRSNDQRGQMTKDRMTALNLIIHNILGGHK